MDVQIHPMDDPRGPGSSPAPKVSIPPEVRAALRRILLEYKVAQPADDGSDSSLPGIPEALETLRDFYERTGIAITNLVQTNFRTP